MTFTESKGFQKLLEILGVGPDQTMGEWGRAIEELCDTLDIRPEQSIQETINLIL